MEDNKGIILQMNEDGVWDIKPEPYATIEVATEEDFNNLVELTEKYHAEKPIVEASSTYKCAKCKELLSDEAVKSRYKHCPDCGQKLDWTEYKE